MWSGEGATAGVNRSQEQAVTTRSPFVGFRCKRAIAEFVVSICAGKPGWCSKLMQTVNVEMPHVGTNTEEIKLERSFWKWSECQNVHINQQRFKAD